MIRAGVVTCGTGLMVGAVDGSVFTVTGGNLGLGTASPITKVHVDGRVRARTYTEEIIPLSISAGNVDVDLSKGQSFTLTVDSAVTQFTIINPPGGGSGYALKDAATFTIKILQNATGYSVDIDDFRNAAGNAIDVYWPGGGVIPVVTSDANKTDIYSFKTFDSCASLYGIVGGQNFVA